LKRRYCSFPRDSEQQIRRILSRDDIAYRKREDASVIVAENLEAQRVIALRLMKLAGGGPAAQKEAQKMFNEKIGASLGATNTLVRGGSPQTVLKRYRTITKANARRLAAPKRARRY